MKKHIATILMVLMVFVGGFFLGRWSEGKRRGAICQVAIMEAEKRKDEYWNAELERTTAGFEDIIRRKDADNDSLMRLIK